MSEKLKQELNGYISQYAKIVQDSLGNDDSKSLAKNKIIFQNYYGDFSNFIKTSLEECDAKRYSSKLDSLNQMIELYFLFRNGQPATKLLLMDQNEDLKKPEFRKLFRTIEETSNFFAIELERLSESKIKFIQSKANKSIDDRKLLKKAFIVHGHDVATQQKTARFLEQIGFEAIILSEKPSKGMTIIEKLEHYIDPNGFGVVLYTPDDEGSVKDKNDYKPRARQNVVFEHGWLIGALGRNKVIQVVTDHIIELPNDISGVVYLNDKNWKLDFMNEIHAMGYDVDYNLLRKP